MINYRTLTTLAATALFQWLVRIGLIDLTNPVVTKETLEAAITTALLILAAIFRKYAGQAIFKKKPTTPQGGFMKLKLIALIACLIALFGMGVIQAAEKIVEFSWSHSVPPDIAKYTIYELDGQGGNKTGTKYDMPYAFEGVTDKDFVYKVTIEVPAGVTIQKCYTLTASDISLNESADSAEACGDIFVPDSDAPPSCTNFKFK